jgi:hypothetical protein
VCVAVHRYHYQRYTLQAQCLLHVAAARYCNARACSVNAQGYNKQNKQSVLSSQLFENISNLQCVIIYSNATVSGVCYVCSLLPLSTTLLHTAVKHCYRTSTVSCETLSVAGTTFQVRQPSDSSNGNDFSSSHHVRVL